MLTWKQSKDRGYTAAGIRDGIRDDPPYTTTVVAQTKFGRELQKRGSLCQHLCHVRASAVPKVRIT